MLTFLDTPARTTADAGRGTLVLLHAFPLNAHLWEEQRGFADRGWRVIAPHFDGFGGSDLVRETPSMDDYADDVIALLRELGVEHAVIGGLSMGGYAAFAMLRKWPQGFRGLVLADTRPQADTPEGLQARRNMLALAREQGSDAVAVAMLPNLLGRTTREKRPHVVANVGAAIREAFAPSIAAAIQALMSRRDSSDLLPAIAVPTLIIVGE